MKEYQYRRDKNYVLPHSVYYQCIWIIRDRSRLSDYINNISDKNTVSETSISYDNASLDNLSIIQEAEYKLDAIELALASIPEVYRDGILDNITNYGSGYSSVAHDNTWKLWKQRFIYNLAELLHLV